MSAPTTEPRADELTLLREGAQLFLDWHSLDTRSFVAKYGTGMTLRHIGDKFRAALHPEPETT